MTEIKKQEATAEEKPNRPEPPKDENGNPIKPPFPGHHGPKPSGNWKDGERPEPPKDENGNPIKPPFPGHHGSKPENAEGTTTPVSSGTIQNI